MQLDSGKWQRSRPTGGQDAASRAPEVAEDIKKPSTISELEQYFVDRIKETSEDHAPQINVEHFQKVPYPIEVSWQELDEKKVVNTKTEEKVETAEKLATVMRAAVAATLVLAAEALAPSFEVRPSREGRAS